MLFMFECSRPSQKKPWWYRSDMNTRIGWLWFAFSFYRMREDELLAKAERGDIEMEFYDQNRSEFPITE